MVSRIGPIDRCYYYWWLCYCLRYDSFIRWRIRTPCEHVSSRLKNRPSLSTQSNIRPDSGYLAKYPAIERILKLMTVGYQIQKNSDSRLFFAYKIYHLSAVLVPIALLLLTVLSCYRFRHLDMYIYLPVYISILPKD